MLIDHRPFGDDREAFERALDAALNAQRIDLVCLAGFMRLFTPWFVTRWSGRLLNIHPALLPQFKGLDTHRRALEAGVTRHGATVHFVVQQTDFGTDHRPGVRSRSSRATPKRHSPRGYSKSSTAFIRRRYAWSPKVGYPLAAKAMQITPDSPRCACNKKPPGAKPGAARTGLPRPCLTQLSDFPPRSCRGWSRVQTRAPDLH